MKYTYMNLPPLKQNLKCTGVGSSLHLHSVCACMHVCAWNCSHIWNVASQLNNAEESKWQWVEETIYIFSFFVLRERLPLYHGIYSVCVDQTRPQFSRFYLKKKKAPYKKS